MPRVSIVMTVYNTREAYLREAIQSILSQTFSDFELIIIDDGSKENDVKNVVFSYCDSRIKYIYQDNAGIGRAPNAGIALAQGEYIARMDSDDVSLPQRLEKQVHYLDVNRHISLVGSWFQTFPEKKIKKTPERVGLLDLFDGCRFGHSTVMWRREDFERYGLKYSDRFSSGAEDYHLWSRAARYLSMGNIQEVLVRYRLHDESISVRKLDSLKNNEAIIRNELIDFLTSDPGIKRRVWNAVHGKKEIRKVFVFSKIPFLKIVSEENRIKWYLFGFLRILKITISNA